MPREREADVAICATSGMYDADHRKYLPKLLKKLDEEGISHVEGNLKKKKRRTESILGLPAVGYLWCLTGGYTTPELPVRKLAEKFAQEIVTVGYSDNDLLNLWTVSNKGLAIHGMHAGMAMTWSKESISQLLDLFTKGKYPEIEKGNIKKIICPGQAEGMLFAGGINQIVEWLAMDGNLDLPQDMILFIEDNEQTWDTHKRQVEVVMGNINFRSRLRGVIFGRRTEMLKGGKMNAGNIEKKYQKIFTNQDLFPNGIAVGVWEEFGHAADKPKRPPFFPLVMGEIVKVEVDTETGFSLKYQTHKLYERLYT